MALAAPSQDISEISDRVCAETLKYYDAQAERYAHQTLEADLTHLYGPFLALMLDRGHILDAGSGSGRDTLHFMRTGYRVTAFDGSGEMAQVSTKITRQRTLHCRFQDIRFDEAFDGVWANASLLHVPPSEIDDVLQRLTVALKPGGVLFCSFKRGNGEYVEDGRYFNCYTEGNFTSIITRHSGLICGEVWTNPDATREGLTWLNVLMRRMH